MEYLKKSFSVAVGGPAYSESWERTFGAKAERAKVGSIPGELPSQCPKCGASSPCIDRVEVDIGVGIQTGLHEYLCPEHGRFGFGSDGPIFEEDAPEVHGPPGLDPCTKCGATGHEFPACGDTSPPCPRCFGTKMAW